MEEHRLNLFKSLLDSGDIKAFRDYYGRFEPIDNALVIAELDDEDLAKVCEILSDEEMSGLLENADDKLRMRLADLVDDSRLMRIFEGMQKDDIVDIIGDMEIGRRKAIVNRLHGEDRRIITELLKYPDDSAGGLMTTAYVALRESLNISQSLEKIREIGPKTEVIETIYVVNQQRRLIGSVDLRDVLNSKPRETLGSIMNQNVISVEPETDQEEVAGLVSRYDLKSIPVVSRRGAILGIITMDDIIDVIVEEYNEDILQLAGVSKEENLSTTLGESIKMRLPWLLINLVTAFLASFTIKMFESTIAQVVALSSIMSIVTGMGGNAGTQTMSIIVRELAMGEIRWERIRKAFGKEILLGIINGAATGLITGLIVTLVYGNHWLGVIIFISMIGNLIVAGVFGFLVPFIIHGLHADPAVSSSIFVTTATDVLGFFIFLGLAKLFLPLLV